MLDAISTLKSGRDEQRKYYKLSEIAVAGVIRPKWREVVIEEGPDGEKRVNRINYELCVLQSLREQVRCKEVWIAGSERFRNPDDDLPIDFEERRASCYERLDLPRAADAFIEKLQKEMATALARLDRNLPQNAHVRLDPRRKKKPLILSPRNWNPVTRLAAMLAARPSRLTQRPGRDMPLGFELVFFVDLSTG